MFRLRKRVFNSLAEMNESIAHGDGRFRKRLNQLAKADLLILDDSGIAAMNAIDRSDLLEVIEQRTGNRWHDYLSGGDSTLAEPILDRLVSGAHRIELKGCSMRKRRGQNMEVKE